MGRSGPFKVVLVAGEASGDTLGGDLLRGLQERLGPMTLLGVGGGKMAAQGLHGAYDVADLSSLGVAEVLHKLPRLWRIFRHLEGVLRDERPDLLVTIDYPDFNLPLARRARRLGVPVIHYVGPQVWAWRAGRARRLAQWIDHLLVLFPFEPVHYAGTGLAVTFVGHPLVESARPHRPAGEVRRELGVGEAGGNLVALLPGSRHGELERLLPVMLEGCRLLLGEGRRVRFALAVADTLDPGEVAARVPEGLRSHVTVRQGMTHDLVGAADAAVVASGTATLETALIGTPMTVCYKVNPITYRIGRQVIRVPFISLANLVAGRALVPERIQHEANGEQLAADVARLLDDEAAAAAQREGFAAIRASLATPSRSAAEVVAEFLRQRATQTRIPPVPGDAGEPSS